MSVREQSAGFDPSDYWERRLEESVDLSAVGYQGLGQKYNEWLYRVRERQFVSQVQKLDLDLARAQVLDIGSGTGFYVGLWRRLGANSVIGSDLTLASTRQLRVVYPDIEVKQLDITAQLPTSLEHESCDVVSAFDMFFHIVDQELFRRAIANIAEVLKPGGTLLFTDSLTARAHPPRSGSQTHIVFRQKSEVFALLEQHGLRVEDERPAFVLMNEPVDSVSVLHKGFWALVTRTASLGEWSGDLVGRALFPVEMRLLAGAKRTPSTIMVSARKR